MTATPAAMTKRAAQIYMGAEVCVFAKVATIADTIPIMRLNATATPLPVPR